MPTKETVGVKFWAEVRGHLQVEGVPWEMGGLFAHSFVLPSLLSAHTPVLPEQFLIVPSFISKDIG